MTKNETALYEALREAIAALDETADVLIIWATCTRNTALQKAMAERVGLTRQHVVRLRRSLEKATE